jgi:predicted Rossmann fold flavoprotein
MKEIAIIGGGPAGIMAAIQAAQGSASVHLFEANPKLGKKLLVTGSGRCNITNLSAVASKYDSDDDNVLGSVLAGYPPQQFRTDLVKMGIFTYATADGWVYPISNSAANVQQLLLSQLSRAGVKIHCAAKINAIHFKEQGFNLIHEKHDAPHQFDLLCVAVGGKAMPDLGSDGHFLPVLNELRHTILPMQPALAPITFEDKTLHSLDGVRLDVEASLWRGTVCLRRETGNVIFTQWGMNGPAVMNLSHLLPPQPDKTLGLQVNFLPGYDAQARQFLEENINSEECLPVLLGGFLHQKISEALCKKIGIPDEMPFVQIPSEKLEKLFVILTGYKVIPTGTRGFKYAQLTSGGVPLGEVQPGTLESRKQAGLYLAGEVLNVVGPCGGYNLHWAFASGYTAGRAMAAHS